MVVMPYGLPPVSHRASSGLKAVGQANHNHSEVQQVGDDGEQCRFLAAVLGCGRAECTTDFSMQCAFRPQTATLIEERGHLRNHPSKAGGSADDDGIVVGQLIYLRNGGFLVGLVMRSLCDVGRDRLGHPFDVDGRACRARTFRDCIRHRFDVTVRGVVQDEDFCHGVSPLRVDSQSIGCASIP